MDSDAPRTSIKLYQVRFVPKRSQPHRGVPARFATAPHARCNEHAGQESVFRSFIGDKKKLSGNPAWRISGRRGWGGNTGLKGEAHQRRQEHDSTRFLNDVSIARVVLRVGIGELLGISTSTSTNVAISNCSCNVSKVVRKLSGGVVSRKDLGDG